MTACEGRGGAGRTSTGTTADTIPDTIGDAVGDRRADTMADRMADAIADRTADAIADRTADTMADRMANDTKGERVQPVDGLGRLRRRLSRTPPWHEERRIMSSSRRFQDRMPANEKRNPSLRLSVCPFPLVHLICVRRT